MKFAPALAALALLIAPALGGMAPVESADLTLAKPAAQTSYIIDGASWSCAGTACHAGFVDDMPAFRSCKRIVSVTGAVTSFTWRGKALSADEIAVCNARAAS